jgi:hypothetical protein
MAKGIIFSTPMVRALLAGRKTQTRRLVQAIAPPAKPRPHDILVEWPIGDGLVNGAHFRTPYTPGDRLYVREAITVRSVYTDVVEVGYRAHANASHTEFVEQWPVETARDHKGRPPKVTWPQYRPSIHMPRWASRLWLEVTDVRVQRLQEISEADARCEGVERAGDGWRDYQGRFSHMLGPRECFATLWNSLHTVEGERWQDNPWIVAVSFTVHHGNINGASHG